MWTRRVIVSMVVMSLVSVVQAVPTVPVGQGIYDTTQSLSIASPNFYTNFKATQALGLAEVWAVAGSSNTSGEAWVNWQYGAGNLNLGTWNYQNGTIIYRFATTDMFNGGTVTNSANYQGGFNHMYVATTAVAPTTTNGWNGFSITPYDKKFYTNYWNEGTYSVNIPVGVQEFWVVISKPDGGSSNESYQRYLNVQANIVPVPEPAKIALLSLGGLALRMARKKQ